MRRTLSLVLSGSLVMAMTLLGATPAAACTCEPYELADLVDEANLVFVGTEDHHSTHDESITYTFKVETIYRGDIGSEVEVVTHASSSMCGVDSIPRGSVGVLAFDDHGEYQINSCGSIHTAGAFADLLPGHPPPAPGPSSWPLFVVGIAAVGLGAWWSLREPRRTSAPS